MKDHSVLAPGIVGRSRPEKIHPEKLLRSIVDVICAFDEEGIIRYVSPSCADLFGYEAEEMEGTSFLRFIHPEDLHRTLQSVAVRTHDCRTSHFENRYIRKDGTVVHVLWSARWDEHDGILYCVARDASEKLLMEQRLKKAQQMAKVANYEYDPVQNRYTYTSDTLFEIFGIDRGENPVFLPEHFWSLVHPDDLRMVQRNIDQPPHLYQARLDYRIIRPNGELAYISRIREVVRDHKGKPIMTIGTIQDITETKMGELALKRSEERFRFLVENGNDLLGIIDAQGNYIFASTNVQHNLGYLAEQMVGRNAFEFIHPDDVPWVSEYLKQSLDKDIVTVGPFRFLSGTGDWRWVETTVSNHLNNPAVGGLAVNSRDVTEKKLKDDALLLSQQRFKALVQHGSDLIVVIDEAANFTYVSNNSTDIIGYAPDEIIGKNVFAFIHAHDAEAVAMEIAKVLKDDGSAKGVQHRFFHKNGSWVWLESKGTNHSEHSMIGGILVNARNINDRVQLQERLDQELINKQKEITSAVIRAQETERSQLGLELHDNVNQVLTTVKLYTEMYLAGYAQGKELLLKSTQYTQDCINEIRSISKRLSAPTLGEISLDDSIMELVNSINLTRRVEIQYTQEGLKHCQVPEDLHLAIYRIVQEGLNNIIKYAKAKTAFIRISRCEARLCLSVADDGIGFDTTAKRAGIGITNMKTRAENLNATFQLESAPGCGCRIEICFPFPKAGKED